MNFIPTIGLEVHVQLNTKKKLFANAETSFGAEPNSHVSTLCLALPGALPVLNREALQKAVLAGIALKGNIHRISKFDRKHYFYPDLPKAYQISQFYEPFCTDAQLLIELGNGKQKVIHIARIHLEEDAGKLIHSEYQGSTKESFIDLNRAGIPLIEIVSEAEIENSEEAYLYLTELKRNMEYIDVSDCNMEEGSLRCDANVSIRPEGSDTLGTRVEVKNLNTFKGVRSAIDFEIERQKDVLVSGEKVFQETRLWNSSLSQTISMRGKEEAHDYRYFPDPDLTPAVLTEEEVDSITAMLPELALDKKERFLREYKIPEYDAKILTNDRELANYFEDVVSYNVSAKKASNWIMSEIMAITSEKRCSLRELCAPKDLASLIQFIESGKISGKIAKDILQDMIKLKETPQKIIEQKNLLQITDESKIHALVIEVITENQESVDFYKKGKDRVLGFLVGQVMKKSKGKANPPLVNSLLLKELKK